MVDRSWYWRRWAVFSSLTVCDLVIMYLTVLGVDTRLNQDLANGALLLIAALVNGYVFGSAWDDRNKGKEAIAAKAVESSSPTTTETKVEVNQ